MILVKEDFKDLLLGEFPYDKEHTALGEYHFVKPEGVYGNWYDPICLFRWRSMGGSWLVTEDLGVRYLEQNRGDNTSDAYKDVYCCLVHNEVLYSGFNLSFELRIFELNEYSGMAFNYVTSRCYDFVGIKGNKISVIRRIDDDFIVLGSADIVFDCDKTYKINININDKIVVSCDDVILTVNECFKEKTRLACVSKSCCRYSNIVVEMDDLEYEKHVLNKKIEEERLNEKRKEYPKLECIKKIDLKNFGSGRQIRICRVDGKTIFVMAQHQKRMFRDAFARISCLTCFDIDGNVLWQKGEPNNSFDNTMISCDLPFQIADVNGDGKLEIIYSVDFNVIICDLLSGVEIKRMKTPVVYGDDLVNNHPYYRLNVDAIRVADFKGVGYKSDFIIKDRYQNVWAYDADFNNIWRYNHKNTGHFPYVYDFNNDGKDEVFIGYDLVSASGEIMFSLPMNSDHTDEIIYARLFKNEPKRLILASGNEGFNICNIDGTVYKHNNIGHAQRISVAKFRDDVDGLQVMTTSFWGGDGIISIFDGHGNKLAFMEQRSNGNLITPVNYDGVHVLALLNGSSDGGLIDGYLDKVVLFPFDGHPNTSLEVYDIDGDGVDEIICFDVSRMWIYKASEFVVGDKYVKYSDDAFSNYRGEFLIPYDYD